jgi:hypothetical protein
MKALPTGRDGKRAGARREEQRRRVGLRVPVLGASDAFTHGERTGYVIYEAAEVA